MQNFNTRTVNVTVEYDVNTAFGSGIEYEFTAPRDVSTPGKSRLPDRMMDDEHPPPRVSI